MIRLHSHTSIDDFNIAKNFLTSNRPAVESLLDTIESEHAAQSERVLAMAILEPDTFYHAQGAREVLRRLSGHIRATMDGEYQGDGDVAAVPEEDHEETLQRESLQALDAFTGMRQVKPT